MCAGVCVLVISNRRVGPWDGVRNLVFFSVAYSEVTHLEQDFSRWRAIPMLRFEKTEGLTWARILLRFEKTEKSDNHPNCRDWLSAELIQFKTVSEFLPRNGIMKNDFFLEGNYTKFEE